MSVSPLTEPAPDVAITATPERSSPGFTLFWLLALLVTAWLLTPGFLTSLRPPEGQIFDFFKEWSAAKNYFAGLPVYASQRTAVKEHLGIVLPENFGFFEEHNTHPPTANLLAFPFASLSYPNAHFAWNLVSLGFLAATLWLCLRELRQQLTARHCLVLIPVLLLCDPLRQTLIQGQPNLLLGFLITATWALARNGRPFAAGCVLALAGLIKIYPLFLFLYFLAKRDWRALAGGLCGGILITALTAALLGPQAYVDYVTVSLPDLQGFTSSIGNISLPALCERLFGSPDTRYQPLWFNPVLREVSKAILLLMVVAAVSVRAWQSRTRHGADAAFFLVVTAVILVSPIAWNHYFTILLPAFLFLLHTTPSGSLQRKTVYAVAAALTLSPRLIWYLLLGFDERSITVVTPWHSLTGLACQTYAVIALALVLQAQIERPAPRTRHHSPLPTQSVPDRGQHSPRPALTAASTHRGQHSPRPADPNHDDPNHDDPNHDDPNHDDP